MPLNRYNKAFGGERGSAAKALSAMRADYGAKKGTSVFYATANEGKQHMKSNLPHGAPMPGEAWGDVGAHRQEESVRVGGFVAGKTLHCKEYV